MHISRGVFRNSDDTISAVEAITITPNDATDLSKVTRGLYIGATGNVRVLLYYDTVPVTFVGAVTGSVLPIRVKRVYATGTTATSLVGLL